MKPGRRLGTHSVQHGFYRERRVRASRSVADYCGDRLRALSSAPDCNDKRGYEVRVHLEKGLARPWAEPLVTRLRVGAVNIGPLGQLSFVAGHCSSQGLPRAISWEDCGRKSELSD